MSLGGIYDVKSDVCTTPMPSATPIPMSQSGHNDTILFYEGNCMSKGGAYNRETDVCVTASPKPTPSPVSTVTPLPSVSVGQVKYNFELTNNAKSAKVYLLMGQELKQIDLIARGDGTFVGFTYVTPGQEVNYTIYADDQKVVSEKVIAQSSESTIKH